MELILTIGLIASVITNYILIKKVMTPVEPIILERIIEKIVEKVPEEPPVVSKVQVPDDSQFAWSNKTNIPMGPNRPAPDASLPKPPQSGPLERPAGFYR